MSKQQVREAIIQWINENEHRLHRRFLEKEKERLPRMLGKLPDNLTREQANNLLEIYKAAALESVKFYKNLDTINS
ncbi:hypothetical protein [Endozoicomonas sp. ONNA1]|uniref:hypothetical protein n=1 Tax=Endozoicomonas sp. ONNA1 TaxID=2828740 RepID=UPI00214912D9|nr:hypothetical protein [Endozoicomonas sp. ONNA1]